MEINSKAYKEVWEILKFLPQKYIDKVPSEILNKIKNEMDINYDFNPENDEEWLEETKAIIVMLFQDYWANKEQLEALNIIYKNRINIEEEKKREKYNPDEVFKKENKKLFEDNLPAEIEKKTFIQLIIDYIRRLFRKGN